MVWNEDRISAEAAVTLYGLLLERVRRTPLTPAYGEYDRASESWRALTWSEFAARVASWQQALASEGLARGARVALSLRNSIDWVAFDQAAQGLGLVTVPLYTDDRPDNVAYILENAGVELLLVHDPLRWHRIEAAVAGLPALRRVVVLECEPDGCFTDPRVLPLSDWLPEHAAELRPLAGSPHDLATVVYTSGTTGRPKGVMLSHHNILSVVDAGLNVVTVYREDRFLSFLPLSHMFERTVGYYLPMSAGAEVVFARSVNQLADDLAAARPTVLIAVPRVFERVHGRIMQQMAKASAVRRALFSLAVNIGWRRFLHGQRRIRWSPSLLLWPLCDALVARKVRARLGGRLRMVVSGGAPLSPDVARLFLALDLPLLQGYGLTEAGPQVSVNQSHDNDPASVGPPLPGIEVRIGANDELLVRSPGVMLGYWHNPEATAAVIHGGWLHTGDQARFDQGRIYITGRIKDVLVLSNGEKVPPGEMEAAIAMDPLIEQVLVVGEGKAFLGALVVLNAEAWAEYAAGLHLDPATPASLEDRGVHHDLLQRIAIQLHDFPSWAKVRRVHAVLEPWTVENGLMTPTMKVKRGRVVEQFRDAIETMYR